MHFPNGSFQDSHMELPLETSPSPSTWQKQLPAVRGDWARGPGRAGTQPLAGLAVGRGAVSCSSGSPKAAGMSPGVCPAPTSSHALQHLSVLRCASLTARPPPDGHALGWGAFPPLPDAHLLIMLPLQGKRNRRKKVNRFLIMPCLLSFRANSAHTKVILHIKRNIYFKKTQMHGFIKKIQM